MLDLECADANSFKPVIIEIGAVNFNIDTGEELSSFSTLINFESCIEKGLETSPGTMGFLHGNKTLAATLEKSKASPVTIVEGLMNFTHWIKECQYNNPRMTPRPEVLVWGNGSVADNVWIKSAYRACGMGNKIPWMYYGDRCVRTVVQECFDVTGKNYMREEKRVGTAHVAVDDCRHQVRYLVKARNELAGRAAQQGPQGRTGLMSPQRSFHRHNESEKRDDGGSALMQPVPTGLLPLETSFSRPEGPGNEKGTGDAEIEGLKKMPLGLISPNNSFSVPPIGAEKMVSVTAEEGEPDRKRKRTDTAEVEGPRNMAPGLTTPNDSFSFPPIGAEAVSVSADEGEPARKRKRKRLRSVAPVLVVEPILIED